MNPDFCVNLDASAAASWEAFSALQDALHCESSPIDRAAIGHLMERASRLHADLYGIAAAVRDSRAAARGDK